MTSVLHIADYVIVFVYLVLIVAIGVYVQRKTKENMNSYFLGSREIPWWVLGASGMSSNFDVSGTMINTALVYALGVAGFYVELRGGVTLLLAFLLAFMGKWNRRSQVMTMAEWMQLRFGKGRQGDTARIVAAVVMIVFSTIQITYFAVGSGKFVGEFLGIPDWIGLPSSFWSSLVMIGLAMIYTLTSGLTGVVWTDVFQGVIILVSIVFISIYTIIQIVPPAEFTISDPLLNGGFRARNVTFADWANVIPPWKLNVPADSTYSSMSLFGLSISFYLLKVVAEGLGGPTNYMSQRYFAAKDDRSVGVMTLYWILLLAFRWPFIMSVALLGILQGMQGSVIADPEKVLPTVIGILPTGIRGLCLAAMISAAMSTFDSTVNAGAAYWVKDIYQEYINPSASQKRLMFHSRLSSILMVLFGLFGTLIIRDVNDVWGFINMSIGVGLFMPLVLRWYWPRFNGYGFAASCIAGSIAAVIERGVAPNMSEWASFLIGASISLAAGIIVAWKTEATDSAVLEKFYMNTRPFGWWKKYQGKLSAESQEKINYENKMDIWSCVTAVPFQIFLFLFAMMLVARTWPSIGVLASFVVVLSIILYRVWWRRVSIDPVVVQGGGADSSFGLVGAEEDGAGRIQEDQDQDGSGDEDNDNIELESTDISIQVGAGGGVGAGVARERMDTGSGPGWSDAPIVAVGDGDGEMNSQ